MAVVALKNCLLCGNIFEPSRRGKPQIYCSKKCCKKVWALKNRELLNLLHKKWCKENPEKRSETNRLYRKKNKKQCADWTREWSERNPGKMRELKNLWRRENRDKYLESRRVYYKQNIDKFRKEARDRQRDRKHLHSLIVWQKNVCPLCDKMMPEDLSMIHVDHIYPKSLGGSDQIHNLQAVHAKCNIKKGNKIINKRRSRG